MEYRQIKVETFEKFTWRIENFSRVLLRKLYSETFMIGGHAWRILVFPTGNNVDFLSVYLDAGRTANLHKGWTRDAEFKLVLHNQVNSDMSITKEARHQFNGRENDWGFTSVIPLAEFSDPHKGFLVNDACIVSAEIYVPKAGRENQVDQVATQTASQTSGSQARHMEVEVPTAVDIGKGLNLDSLVLPQPQLDQVDKGMSSASTGELVDFRGLGQIEKVFIPFLEDVCSQHPSLIECQQKRSRKFTEWAFTALGRVLHFLKTRRVRDMNDHACDDLQILWEELETFRFDLTWLEPHVQSALGLQSYLGRAMQVQKLKENVLGLELEMKRLKTKLAATEVDLSTARRELLKAREGFEERDLDLELGYGIP